MHEEKECSGPSFQLPMVYKLYVASISKHQYVTALICAQCVSSGTAVVNTRRAPRVLQPTAETQSSFKWLGGKIQEHFKLHCYGFS
jgi:hypothetical protein